MELKLKIDPEFESKIPPLTEEEFEQLEENIVADNEVLVPLVVWNGVIVDGHNRYKVICKHPEIKYTICEKEFADRYEAIIWICRNQLGRRNLTPQQRKYVIGQKYEAEKLSSAFHGNQYTLPSKSGADKKCPHQNTRHFTRDKIAKETNSSPSYVREAGRYAKGIDAADAALPGMKQELLSGQIKPKDSDVAAVAYAPKEERQQLVEKLRVSKPKAEKRKPHRGSRKYAIQEIEKISEEMTRPKTVNSESAIFSLKGAVNMMMNTCDSLFERYPDLLNNPAYKTQVLQILRETQDYIHDIEAEQRKTA